MGGGRAGEGARAHFPRVKSLLLFHAARRLPPASCCSACAHGPARPDVCLRVCVSIRRLRGAVSSSWFGGCDDDDGGDGDSSGADDDGDGAAGAKRRRVAAGAGDGGDGNGGDGLVRPSVRSTIGPADWLASGWLAGWLAGCLAAWLPGWRAYAVFGLIYVLDILLVLLFVKFFVSSFFYGLFLSSLESFALSS